MSVLISDLRLYGSANMPEADGSTVGGAIDFTKRVEFEGSSISTLFDAVSSSASDTATKITYSGRDSTGVVQTETLTLTGQTKVNGTKTLERLLAGVTTGGAIGALANPGGTTAVGDVALIAHTLTVSAHTMQTGSAQATSSNPAIAKLQSGDGASVSVGMVLRTTGGTGPNQIRRILAINPNGLGADVVAVDRNWGTLPDNTTTYEVGHGFHFELTGSNAGAALAGTSTQVLAITRLFTAATANPSGGADITFYEKFFINNNNQSTALTGASVAIQALAGALPGSDTFEIAVANALNDLTTIANRQTAPASATAFTAGAPPQSVNVPSPQNLPASASAGSATGAQGIWAALLAKAGSVSYEGVATIRTNGSST
jgi:hypothetical protein